MKLVTENDMIKQEDNVTYILTKTDLNSRSRYL